jgi:hypothetical protein
MKTHQVIMSILAVLIIINLLIIKNKDVGVTTLQSDNDKYLKDSIDVLNTRLKISQENEQKLIKAYDSLESIEPQIITRTREKIEFIVSDATPDQLDSIIRSAFHFKPRYN